MIFYWWMQITQAQIPDTCEAVLQVEQLQTLLDETELAFQKMESDSFVRLRQQIHDELPCIAGALSGGQAAQLHRVEVLYAFSNRDMAALGGHVRAAKNTNPDVPVVAGMVQEGHPLDVLTRFAEQEVSAPRVTIPRPAVGKVRVDGMEAQSVPPDLPYVFQRVNNQGQALQTSLVSLGEPVPSYPTWFGETVQVPLEPRLTIGAGGAAILAVGLGSVAYFQEQKFWNPSTAQNELDKLQRRTNRLTTSSLVFGTASAGLLVAAGITGSW